MSIQYIHRVSEKLAPDLGLSEKLPPSPPLRTCRAESDSTTSLFRVKEGALIPKIGSQELERECTVSKCTRRLTEYVV